MAYEIQARVGQIVGHDHMARRVNCQDGYALLQTDDFVIGVVCDGCGEGKHSEIGAKLAAQYLAGQILSLLEEDVPLAEMPALLHTRLIAYLDELVQVSKPLQPLQFIKENLLFTTLGVVCNKEDSLLFAAGDGTILIDETLHRINQNNQPMYIAYNLIEPELLGDFIMPEGFEVYPCDSSWQRLAIASDGFDEDLFPKVWGQKNVRGLQRRVNVWSDRERRFRDDATLITVERLAVPDVEKVNDDARID